MTVAPEGCPSCGHRRPPRPARVIAVDLAQLRLPFPELPPVAIAAVSSIAGDRCLTCGHLRAPRPAALRVCDISQLRLPFTGRVARPRPRLRVVIARSAADREALILSALDLVHSLARKIRRGLPPGVDREELVSSGMVGLVTAADRFDPAKGLSFRKFASARVYGAIIDDLRNRSILKRRGLEKARRGEAQAFEHPIAELEDDEPMRGADYGVTLPAAPARQLRGLANRDTVDALLEGIDHAQALVVRAVFLEGQDVDDVAAASGRRRMDVQALLDAGLAALRALAGT